LTKGYTEEQVKNIEKAAPKKWNACISDWTYQLLVESSGCRDTETTSNATEYVPMSNKRPDESSKASGSEKRFKADPEVRKAELEQKKLVAERKKEADMAAKKAEAERKQAQKAETALAKKVVGILAPLLTEGQQMIRVKCVQPNIAAKLPDYIVSECSDLLRKLELANAAWTDVINGQTAPGAVHLQLEAIQALKKDAGKAFGGLTTMIDLASR
jgi:hypothetical protein